MREKCGVIGIFGKGLEAARLCYLGLWALQHRGQESSGIASSDGKSIAIHKGMGLVAHVYSEGDLEKLPGHLAIGHNRYATSGPSTSDHSQPVFSKDKTLALAHNGNLPSTLALEKFLLKKGISSHEHNDSDLMHLALTYYLTRGLSLAEAVEKCFPMFTGAFSVVMMTKDTLIAVRDECGIRPLCLGKINGGFVVASETCALDTIGAQFIREISPGEMIVIDEKNRLQTKQLVPSNPKLDIFEFVYFARPDSLLLGKSVNEVRRNLGINLAREFQIKADVVIPIPDSAIPAALGYSAESKIPFDHGLIKNRYIHRTFIRPAQKLRDNDIRLKLNPLISVLQGKRVVVIDDSIVRGTTSKKIVQMLKNIGVKEVHLLISSPPVKYPDFYGIDTPDQKDLIAARMTVPEIKKHVGADSLHYLSYRGMIEATGLAESVFCTSCFTGVYPIDIKERRNKIRKSLKFFSN